jgi:Tol biopolymer transport system component
VTRDAIDHEQPRWAPDSGALVYYTPAIKRGEDGAVWEISALGGWPRRVASAIAGADISPDGRRIALFQAAGDRPALTIVTRDGSRAERVAVLPEGQTYTSPRWSPDGRSIAFERSPIPGISASLEIVSVADGTRHDIVQSESLRGLCWLPDGSGLVYSSSRGSTLLYPPIFNLRTIGTDGRADRQLTFGDQSYVQPDVHHTGKLLASRIKGPSDIWKIPITGSPIENTRNATRITRQTGQVRTPSVNPDDTEVVYLSDSGGHGNLWVARTDGSSVRQITFETDPAVVIGVPRWSPVGDLIVFVVIRSGQTRLSVVHADGSGLREIVPDGRGPCWSGDGRWIYYDAMVDGAMRIEKVALEGGHATVVREETGVYVPSISADGSALYYAMTLRSSVFGVNGRTDMEIRRARPEHGPSEVLAQIPGERIPGLPAVLQAVPSPDGEWLVTPLIDVATTNLWALPTAGGALKPLTDFGDRSIVIARSVSWSADGKYIYAAVSEIETDVVLIDGLLD